MAYAAEYEEELPYRSFRRRMGMPGALFPGSQQAGTTETHKTCEVLDAIFYVLKSVLVALRGAVGVFVIVRELVMASTRARAEGVVEVMVNLVHDVTTVLDPRVGVDAVHPPRYT
jgi:hypothetical protein